MPIKLLNAVLPFSIRLPILDSEAFSLFGVLPTFTLLISVFPNLLSILLAIDLLRSDDLLDLLALTEEEMDLLEVAFVNAFNPVDTKFLVLVDLEVDLAEPVLFIVEEVVLK